MADFRKPPTPADAAPPGGLPDGSEGLPLSVILLAAAGFGILVALLWTTGERRPWHRGSRGRDSDADQDRQGREG